MCDQLSGMLGARMQLALGSIAGGNQLWGVPGASMQLALGGHQGQAASSSGATCDIGILQRVQIATIM